MTFVTPRGKHLEKLAAAWIRFFKSMPDALSASPTEIHARKAFIQNWYNANENSSITDWNKRWLPGMDSNHDKNN